MIPTKFFSEHQDILNELLLNRSNNTLITISSKKNDLSPELVLKNVILPRVKKNERRKKQRTKANAEVFTPAWICNIQNNLIDNQWFKKKNIFNKEIFQDWETIRRKIPFTNDLSWEKYIVQTRLEICCGEAPYLTSRYDAVSGKEIKVDNRIGLLDRKLRVVSENVRKKSDWIKYAILALQHIYGYEKNGDSLILARINLFCTFIDFYQHNFSDIPSITTLKKTALIISWNLWQMDCLNKASVGKCYIMDWEAKKKVKFISFLA